MRLDRSVSAFLVARRQAGLSDATLKAYGWQLRRLCAWLEARGVVEIGVVDRALLRAWGASLWDGWSAASVKLAVSAARSWLRWCADEGLVDRGLVECLVLPVVHRRVQRVVSVAEMGLLLAGCGSTVKGARDRALLLLLFDTGLRAAEVCRLRLVDLDQAGRSLSVVIKGGRKERAAFGSRCADALAAWLEVRPAAGCDAVFVSVYRGERLTVSGLRCILRKVGLAAGLAGVTTHAFRRGFAVAATEAGAPSRLVQLAGRWSSIEMVERYTAAARANGFHDRWSPGDLVGE